MIEKKYACLKYVTNLFKVIDRFVTYILNADPCLNLR